MYGISSYSPRHVFRIYIYKPCVNETLDTLLINDEILECGK